MKSKTEQEGLEKIRKFFRKSSAFASSSQTWVV